MANKGSPFEREICRKLSTWWSEGTRDDIFWRSAASGGRATVRSKLGKSTFGQYGDITAVDPIGQPLTRAICIECKRGYSRFSFADAVDREFHHAPTAWEAFVAQADSSARASGALAWALIQRRDKRAALVFVPRDFYLRLRDVGAFRWRPSPFVQMLVTIRTAKARVPVSVVCVTLDDFLEAVTPEHVRRLQA